MRVLSELVPALTTADAAVTPLWAPAPVSKGRLVKPIAAVLITETKGVALKDERPILVPSWLKRACQPTRSSTSLTMSWVMTVGAGGKGPGKTVPVKVVHC